MSLVPSRAFALLTLLSSAAFATNSPPFAPVIIEPATDGEVLSPADVHMATEVMNDPDLGDTHFCSDFQIWSVSPTAMAWAASCVTGPTKVHCHFGDGSFVGAFAGRNELDSDQDYVVRVRHRDSATNWSPFAERPFHTGVASEVFPMKLEDIADIPVPLWLDENNAEISLPSSTNPPFLRIESVTNELLLEFRGGAGVSNAPSLPEHVAIRVRFDGGEPGLVAPRSRVEFEDHDGEELIVYLPPVNLGTGEQAFFWVSANGSSYYGDGGQTGPVFAVLAEGAPVPWLAMQPGYKVEVVATGFQLPVNIAFVPNPGTNAADPSFYVSELYGNIKVVTRGGTVLNYVTNVLNYDPTGPFGGSGEQGITGIAVDPASGDVFASMLYLAFGNTHYPKVDRFHSTDGGISASPPYALDASTNATHGLFDGPPGLNEPGAAAETGSAVAFDGVADVVRFNQALDFGDEFSISAWVKPGGGASIQTILANAESGGTEDGFKFYFNNYPTTNGALVLEVGNGVVPNDSATTGDGLITNSSLWYHVAAAVNRTQGIAELYVNGIQKTEDNTIANDFDRNRPWRLASFVTDDFHLKGSLDEIQIYSRVLASNEVLALYENPGSTAATLRAHYRLDETTLARTTILDMVGETQNESHQVSNLSIGPDGKLYVHNGDGFATETALNTNSFRGKILRLNLDGSAPADNPFFNAADGTNATDYIFAYGFRNPFGGTWRDADGRHYCVENGPGRDRLSRILPGVNYRWDGSDNSMTNFAIYNWVPAHAPVNGAFIQQGTFGGSGFPSNRMDHLFVTESGPTWATGPQSLGKRIVEFVIGTNGLLAAGPTTLIEYNGSGKATAVGIAAGPDGLYFSDLYKDLEFGNPTLRGANILRIRYVGGADFTAGPVAGPPPLTVQFTNTSTAIAASGWSWTFGDGGGSSAPEPTHTFTEPGIYDVTLQAAGANETALAHKQSFVHVGQFGPSLFIVGNTNLNAADSAARTRLENLGYQPVVVKDGPSIATSDATGKLFVAISQTVNSPDISNKFRDVNTPVIIWEQNAYDDMQLTGPTEGTHHGITGPQTQLRLTNAPHFLSAGLTGLVAVASNTTVLSWGVPTTQAIVVATVSTGASRAAIFAYETGALMNGGATAAARRIGFFLGDVTAGVLNSNGWPLFDAAITWIAGHENDTDSDGLADAWETNYFGNLTHASAQTDSDADRMRDSSELIAGTDPTDAGSVFEATAIEPQDGSNLVLRWSSASNRFYEVGRSTNLTEGFQSLQADMPSTPPVNSYTDSLPAEDAVFHRISVRP